MGIKHSKPQVQQVIVVQPTIVREQLQPVNASTLRVVESVTPPPTQQIVVVKSTQQPISFRSAIESITDSLLRVGPWIRQQKTDYENSQCARTWREYKSKFNTEVKTPLCELYETVPVKLTQAKFELISPYTYNQRFTALNVLCALTAIYTITSTRNISAASRLLRTTRNATFMYLLGGLFIAPQIYNPFIRAS